MGKKRILVLYTGGTFGMDETLKIPNLSAKALKSRLTHQVPEMTKLAECDVEIMFNLDSCQMNSTHWFRLASRLILAKNEYDGAVILHGTDTLAYTASALSLLLSPSPFPIVITGAQRPLAVLRSDARGNFLSALEVAATAPKSLSNRVLVVFHDEVFLGSRVRKKSALDFAAFESPRFPVVATIGSQIQYPDFKLPKLRPLSLAKKSWKALNLLSFPSLLNLELTPNFPGDFLTEDSLSSIDGIILTLYTSGTAPTEDQKFIQFLRRAKASFTPIYAITERKDAPAHLSTYAAGGILEAEGVFWCADLTPEAAFVKAGLLKLALPKTTREGYFRRLPKFWPKTISDECGS